jgi:hypothetical protein
MPQGAYHILAYVTIVIYGNNSSRPQRIVQCSRDHHYDNIHDCIHDHAYGNISHNTIRAVFKLTGPQMLLPIS